MVFASATRARVRSVGRRRLDGAPRRRTELDELVEVGRADGVREAGVVRQLEPGEQQRVVAVAQRRLRRAAVDAHDAPGRAGGLSSGRVVTARNLRACVAGAVVDAVGPISGPGASMVSGWAMDAKGPISGPGASIALGWGGRGRGRSGIRTRRVLGAGGRTSSASRLGEA